MTITFFLFWIFFFFLFFKFLIFWKISGKAFAPCNSRWQNIPPPPFFYVCVRFGFGTPFFGVLNVRLIPKKQNSNNKATKHNSKKIYNKYRTRQKKCFCQICLYYLTLLFNTLFIFTYFILLFFMLLLFNLFIYSFFIHW